MSHPNKKEYSGAMISSTFEDLKEHRASLIEILQKQDLFPVGMETRVATTNDTIISSSLKMVEESTAYIGLISHKCGRVVDSSSLNPDGHSITRLEFEKAQTLGLPTLIFIMHDDHFVKRSDVETDSEKIIKLNEFRERAKKDRIYVEFKSLEDFTKQAIHRIAQLRTELDAKKDVPNISSKLTKPSSEPLVSIKPPNLYAQPRYIGSHQFVGREAELEQLDDWANTSNPFPVLLFEAIGGTGKSMLTWEWTKYYVSTVGPNWAGKFWYSFYERGAQMSDFCRHALAYMTGMPIKAFEKHKTPKLTQLLLRQLRSRPWLLILDGLERVLVAYNRIDAAEILDEQVDTARDEIIDRDPRSSIKPEDDDLIFALASAEPSKILISSRLVPKKLINPSSQPITGVQRISLTGLRPKDAEALLLSCGVSGNSKEIRNYLSMHCACHPLVIGILAGLIIDYLPDRGNFDAWAKDPYGGDKLNLGELDLIQKRNHILQAALENLDAPCQQLLSTLSFLTDAIDYPTLSALNPHASSKKGKHKSKEQESLQLQETVKSLEKRGFLQYDRQNHTYNLHPVVRGVVSGRLRKEERTKYGQKVIDYFSQKSHTLYDEAETLEDIRDSLSVIVILLKIGEIEKAVMSYIDSLSTDILTIEAHNENLAILKPLFPNSWSEIPKSVRESHGTNLMNSAAISLDYLGAHNESLNIYYSRLEIELSSENWPNLIFTLSLLGRGFNGMNRLGTAKRYFEFAFEMSELKGTDRTKFILKRYYFNYLLMIGDYENAKIEWENLDKYLDRRWSREVYRLGSIEYSFCGLMYRQGLLEETHLRKAEKLAKKGKNRVVIRYLLRLWGIWLIEQEKWKLAEQKLSKAVNMARSVSQIDDNAETFLALAKFKIGELKDPNGAANELEKIHDQNSNALAQLWFALGEEEKAAENALKAYRRSWGDGEPFVNRYYLEKAKGILKELEVDIPVLPPYDLKKDTIHPVEKKLKKALKKLAAEKDKKN
ncbi:MAG: DUF4062 domain-containing protein [Bacteroidota bacterium]